MYSNFEVSKQCLWIGLIQFSLVKRVALCRLASNSYYIPPKKSQKTNLRRHGAYLKQTIIAQINWLGKIQTVTQKLTHSTLL